MKNILLHRNPTQRYVLGGLLSAAALLAFSLSTKAQTPGSLDADFDADGRLTVPFGSGPTQAYAVVGSAWPFTSHEIRAVGKCETANGLTMAFAAVLTDGTLDSSVDFDGKKLLSMGSHTVAYETLGGVTSTFIVVGETGPSASDHDMMIAKTTSYGELDNAFSTDGFTTIQFVNGQRSRGWDIAGDGTGLVAVGWSMDGGTPNQETIAVARVDYVGNLDNTFSGDGKVLIDFGPGPEWAHAVVTQPDGKIVVAGTYDGPSNSYFAVVRLNTNGTLDNSFGNTGNPGKSLLAMPQQTPLTDAWDVTIDSQGRIVIVGFAGINNDYTRPGIARLNSSGHSDDQFNMGFNGIRTHDLPGSDGGGYYKLRNQGGGRYLCVGFTSNNSNEDFLISMASDNGTLDTDFSGDGFVATSFGTGNERARDVITVVGLQETLMTVVGHSQETPNDPSTFAIARYYPLLTVGIVDLKQLANSILVYPNPIVESTTLIYSLENSEELTIALQDLQGRVLATYLNGKDMPAGEHTQTITLPSDLASGNYLLVFSSPKGRMSVQVSK